MYLNEHTDARQSVNTCPCYCTSFKKGIEKKYFLRAETKDESGKKKTLHGDAAKRHLVRTLLAANYELKSLAEIHPLQSFAYLLEEEEKALVKKKTDEFLASRQGQKGTSSSATPANKRERAPLASATKVKKQKVHHDADNDEKDAVRQLFA
eukprot:6492712-Amphidinium_carterae.1